MKINGKNFIDAVCNMMKHENKNVLLYDRAIMLKIRSLSFKELNELTQLGKWSNDYAQNVNAQGEKHLEN